MGNSASQGMRVLPALAVLYSAPSGLLLSFNYINDIDDNDTAIDDIECFVKNVLNILVLEILNLMS